MTFLQNNYEREAASSQYLKLQPNESATIRIISKAVEGLQTFMDNFRDIIDKNRIITKQRLRKAQLDLALRGDRVLLIWLGKQMLGQSENPVSADNNQILPWIDEDK